MTETHGLDSNLKAYSCLPCRQRKVKCDRIDPCTHCIKSGKQCSFIPPVRGKRKVLKPRKEGTHARLRRYEAMLKSLGAEIETTEHDDEDAETSKGDIDMDYTRSEDGVRMESDEHTAPEEIKPKFLMKDGSSRYFDSALWTGLGDESRHPEETGSTESAEESDPGETDAFIFSPETDGLLSLDSHTQGQDLANLHPPIQHLPTLRVAFVERVDPMFKVLHVPTFWASVIETVNNPYQASKPLVALIFAVYFVVVSSLSEEEVQNVFGLAKSVAFARYRHATRQALAQAGLLTTSNPMVLQAYSVYVVSQHSLRNSLHPLIYIDDSTSLLPHRCALHPLRHFSPTGT